MIDLVKYENYFAKVPTDSSFKKVEHTRIDSDPELDGHIGSLTLWLPYEDGSSLIQTYYDATSDVFRQKTKTPMSWNGSLMQTINHLTLKPVDGDQFSLINTNVEAVKDVPFQSSGPDWRIIKWFIRVTKKSAPFTPVSEFPTTSDHLLCDEIIFKSESLGKTATMRYGYNPYGNGG